MFTGSAALVVAILSAFVLGASLLFSFRDTLQSFREFFDPALFRRLLRCRPRFSLKTLLIMTTVLPPGIAFFAHQYLNHGLPDPVVMVIVVSYFLVVAAPLAYYSLVDAFGPGPHRRWRRFAEERCIDLDQTLLDYSPEATDNLEFDLVIDAPDDLPTRGEECQTQSELLGIALRR